MRQDSVLYLSGDSRGDIRNYAMAAGFFALFALSLFLVVSLIRGDLNFNTGNELVEDYKYILLSTAIVLILSGTALALLHKRDMTAITFILLSIWPLTAVTGETLGAIAPLGVVFILLALIILTTNDEQRWICGILLILTGLKSVLSLFNHADIAGFIDIVIMIVALYSCLAIMSERYILPLREIYTFDDKDKSKNDEQIHFKNSGSALGYALVASVLVGYALWRLNIGNIELVDCSWIEQISGLLLIVLSLVMLLAGKMRYTPFMFMMVGIGMFAAGADEYWLQAGLFMLIGAMTLLHRDPKILPGIVFFIYGLFMVVLAFNNGATDTSSIVSYFAVFVDVVLVVILMYIIAGLYHENVKLI